MKITSAFSSSSVMMVISEDPGKKDIKNAAADCGKPKQRKQITHTQHISHNTTHKRNEYEAATVNNSSSSGKQQSDKR